MWFIKFSVEPDKKILMRQSETAIADCLQGSLTQIPYASLT
jgi:hypothetical protein